MDGVLGIPVAEIVLNKLQIVAAIGTGAGLPHPHCRQAPWRQLRVAHRVGDRGMAKEVLDQLSVRPLVGESVARGVPLHVGPGPPLSDTNANDDVLSASASAKLTARRSNSRSTSPLGPENPSDCELLSRSIYAMLPLPILWARKQLFSGPALLSSRH